MVYYRKGGVSNQNITFGFFRSIQLLYLINTFLGDYYWCSLIPYHDGNFYLEILIFVVFLVVDINLEKRFNILHMVSLDTA